MSNQLIWSDLHLSHVNLATKWRTWAGGTVEDHNDMIAERWNDAVRPHDEVWLIGDACMGKLVESLPLIKALHGTKHLVPGNHDRVHPSYHHKTPEAAEKFRAMYAEVFTIHPPKVLGKDIGLDDRTLICHFPWAGTADHAESDREHLAQYSPKREDYPVGTVLVHGHTHSSQIYGDMSVHVGVDTFPEGPIPLDTLQLLINGARKNGGK